MARYDIEQGGDVLCQEETDEDQFQEPEPVAVSAGDKVRAADILAPAVNVYVPVAGQNSLTSAVSRVIHDIARTAARS